mmetsp:Transcript_22996/g.31514  ORF Transcript_22996/g.31514 Transcript_22996/m.31514 type:complete len:207 (+) Transcript_22996:1-621(+)
MKNDYSNSYSDSHYYSENIDSIEVQANHYLVAAHLQHSQQQQQHSQQHQYQHGQHQDEIIGPSILLDDNNSGKHLVLSYEEKDNHHIQPKLKQIKKKPLQGEEKKLYFLAKYLEQISDETIAMGYLTRFESCERVKKGSPEGDGIIAALIELKVSQRILRNVLGIGFHRFNRVYNGLPPMKKGKKPQEVVDGDHSMLMKKPRLHEA